MGTRADFYVGLGEKAEWLGSIAWYGYPENNKLHPALHCKTEAEFRAEVEKLAQTTDDFTRPEMGWPWPWENSQTTDFAYAFNDDKVQASCFGSSWFDPFDKNPSTERKQATFPDMTDRQKVDMCGPRSGIMVLTVNTEA